MLIGGDRFREHREEEMEGRLPLGEFTCPIQFERVRPPKPVVREESGVTYVVQGDYELAFRTMLRFANGGELRVTGRLFGENSRSWRPEAAG